MRRRLLHELPLLIGVALGLVLLWLFGGAFVFDGRLRGYQWPEYVANAWMVTHGVDVGYDRFRSAGPAWILGQLGEAMGSYPDAAVLLGSMSMAACVGAAALSGRALAGPWAGGLAAACLPLVRCFAQAARWATYYPMQAAGTGLALAFGLATAAWPHPVLALVAGLAASLAWSVDQRGMIAVLPAAALVLFGLFGPGTRLRRGLCLPLFALGLSAWPLAEPLLWQGRGGELALVDKVGVQQDVTLRWIRNSGDDALIAACIQEPPSRMLTLGAFDEPCALAQLTHNRDHTLPGALPFGLGLSALGLALSLLPGRRGWRGTAASALSLGAVASALLLLAAWTPLPQRYLLQLAVPAALVAPVGLARLVGSLPLGRARTALLGISTLLLGLWAWRADPSDRRALDAEERNPAYEDWYTAYRWVEAQLQEGDLFIDCADHHIGIQLLPRIHSPGSPVLTLKDDAQCRPWIQGPPTRGGRALVLVSPGLAVHVAHRQTTVDLAELVAATPGWQRVAAHGALVLWQWSPPG